MAIDLIEFPADDLPRAKRFWEGLLELSGVQFRLSADGRRWLDPASPTYVGTYVEHTLEYWDWWGGLEDVLRGRAGSMLDHGLAPEHPSWPVYIRGQFELARLSADEVARAIKLPSGAGSVLDVAGGHGWFSAALCMRHPGLRATVLDLPGSVAVGREIIREAGMQDTVEHVEGDMLSSDLGGPHDAILAFSIVHHLSTPQRDELLGRLRSALRPGGTLAVLDMFRPEPGEKPVSSAAIFQLFFHLTSGSDVLSEEELRGHMNAAGFGEPRRTNIRSLPDYRLYTAQVR